MISKVVSGIILTLLIVSVFTGFAPVKGVEGISHIIVHALNPEGIEIASIKGGPGSQPPGQEPFSVEIYDGTKLIGYGAHDYDTYNKPIAISPGAHTIRVEFNGMALEQSVNIQEEETKVLTFTFDRTEYPIGSWINGSGVNGKVAVSTSAHLNASDHSVGEAQVHPDLRLSIGFDAGIEIETGKYSNVNYGGVAQVSLGASSYYESWSSDFSCSGNTDVVVNRVGSYEGTLGSVACSFASPHSEFENWYVQNIQYGWYPEVRVSGYGGSGWLCGHQLYPDVGHHEIRLIDAGVAYTYYQISKYSMLWLNQFFGLSVYDPWYWFSTTHPAVDSEHFTAEFWGSLKIKMSSVPYDLAGTGIKYEENQPPVASFTYSPAKPMVGGIINFNASNSYDPDGDIVKYTWNFGDGEGYPLSWPETPHVYEIPDKYVVTLTVTDNDGLTGSVPAELDLTLEIGDLLLCRSEGSYVPADEWTHIGMYIGDNRVVEAIRGERFNAAGSKVKNVVGIFALSDWSVQQGQTWVRTLRVNTDLDTRKKAAAFAKSQVGKPYDLASLFLNDKQAQGGRWYCSELVWAAYLSASGGQIDLDGGEHPIWTQVVSPDDIDSSNHIEKIVGEHKEVRPEIFWSWNRILGGVAKSPVDLTITDPEGLVISKELNEIPEAIYEEADIDDDGDLDDLFAIPEPKMGDYLIQVVPEADALPTDTYSLEVGAGGEAFILAENVQIENVPNQPYILRTTEMEIIPIIQATVNFDPDIINIRSEGQRVTVCIELPVGHGYNVGDIDPKSIKLNGQVETEKKPVEIGDIDDDGIPDIMVQFNRTMVESIVEIGEAIEITITGESADGRLFEGNDTIRVIH